MGLGVIERCYGCKAERDITQPYTPWPQVSAPGAFPHDTLRRDRLVLCPHCAIKITDQILVVADLDRQLGRKSYLVQSSPVELKDDEPFWQAFVRRGKAMVGEDVVCENGHEREVK